MKKNNATLLTIILLFTLIILMTCGGKDRSNSKATDSIQGVQKTNVPETRDVAFLPNYADSIVINNIIQHLSEIEKYAVRDDYNLLYSILKFKGDSLLYKKVIAVLSKMNDFREHYNIKLLDIKNGYINYGATGVDIYFVKTYWNLKDGYKLFATEEWSCATVCDSHLFFQKFKDGKYESIESDIVIPEMKHLPEVLVPGWKHSDEPDEFRYVLPQKGKDIMFCMQDTCIELKWNGSIFEVDAKIRTNAK